MNLSIIVPVLNEVEQLPAFLESLSRQEKVTLELILVDGGSIDGTMELLTACSSSYRWPMKIVTSQRGRAWQLNAGAVHACSPTLLFLHVDSSFTDPQTLSRALRDLDYSCTSRGHHRVAGHFRLRFLRSDNSASFGYFFWEAKARLDRAECIHGDHGFLLRKRFFEEVGPFSVVAPIGEDTLLAERIRSRGEWLLLSDEIWTSARRFESEGLNDRQTLNALLMNFAAIGWDRFFREARDIYSQQVNAKRLDLSPYLALIDRLNRETPWPQRLKRWYRTGEYVRPNAWQLAFLADVRAACRRDLDIDDLQTPRLNCHDRWFEKLTGNFLGNIIAMFGTWVWFRWLVHRYNRPAIN